MSAIGESLFCVTLFYKGWRVLYDFGLLNSQNKPPIKGFQDKIKFQMTENTKIQCIFSEKINHKRKNSFSILTLKTL